MYGEADWLFLTIATAVGIALLWRANHPRFKFYIAIVNGRPHLRSGKTSSEFLEQVEQVCAEFRVSRGWIGCVHRGRAERLVFAGSLPTRFQQRLRNIYFSQ
jgi:hypothetical protein